MIVAKLIKGWVFRSAVAAPTRIHQKISEKFSIDYFFPETPLRFMNIIRGPLIRKTQKPKKNPGFITVASPQIPENLIQIQDKTGKGF